MTLGVRTERAKPRWLALLVIVGLMTGLTATAVFAAPPKITLDQCRNGSATDPNDCVSLGGSAGWVNGNVGAQQGHLVEGYSIPYRARISNAPTDTVITVDIGYDIKHSGAHAIDFLTHYDRLEPHNAFFGHGAETVVPTSGTDVPAGDFDEEAIPTPAGVPQPSTRFNSLPAAEKMMTLFAEGILDGAISSISYVEDGDLTAASSEARIRVTFTLPAASGGNAVLAWGGHIARGLDWDGLSASSISGSPYHMRLKDWSAGNVGNQDRSLSAAAVFAVASTLSTQPDATLDFTATLDDAATVDGNEPTGTVTFKLWADVDDGGEPCDTLLYEEDVDLPAGSEASKTVSTGVGTVISGDNDVSPTATTIYYWTADYSGDALNEPSSSDCGAETVTVIPPSFSTFPAQP